MYVYYSHPNALRSRFTKNCRNIISSKFRLFFNIVKWTKYKINLIFSTVCLLIFNITRMLKTGLCSNTHHMFVKGENTSIYMYVCLYVCKFWNSILKNQNII